MTDINETVEREVAIKASELTKKYGEKLAVDAFSLTVYRGEIFSLLGTNGAGKTTTVKMLSTLIRPTSGDAVLEGFSLSGESAKIKELINVSPQETAIAPNLSVLETLEFMAGVYGIKNKKERIDSLVERFGLSEVLSQRGKTLSGGWQRKLSIAIALINEPKILFLDEPTLGLDVLARKELWRVIEGMRGKTTVVLTTHYMEEAESLSDRVAVMNKGRLIATGTPCELKTLSGKERFEDAFTHIVTGGEF